MSIDELEPESRALVGAAMQHARAIRAEIARLEARDFVLRLPHAVLGEIARRADAEIEKIERLPDDLTFASPSVPTDERLDTLATHVAALRHLHSLLSLLSRVHSSRLPFELVRPFEGLAAQLLQVVSTSLLLRPVNDYSIGIRPWAGPGDSLLGDGGSEELENSFCVMCPSAEVGTFHLFAILAHELGHPFYQRRVLEDVTDDLGTAVDRACAELFPHVPVGEHTAIGREILGRLSKWTEEVFCDLVGARLLGPAYASAFHSTLPLFWLPYGSEDYPSSCLRMAAIEAGLSRWWADEPTLRAVLDQYPLQRESGLTCPPQDDAALRIAAYALTPPPEGTAPEDQPARLFEALVSHIEKHVPSPVTWREFSDAALRAAERIADLTPPDAYLLESGRTFESHELVAFAFISSGLGRARAFDRWRGCYGWTESKCNSVLADLSLKGLEASDMLRRHRLGLG